MIKTGELLARMGQRLDLPPEALGREAQVLLSGNRQLTVDGHRGLRRYGSERIEVRTQHACVCVDGLDLRVSFMNAGRMVIRGRIRALTLEEAE